MHYSNGDGKFLCANDRIRQLVDTVTMPEGLFRLAVGAASPKHLAGIAFQRGIACEPVWLSVSGHCLHKYSHSIKPGLVYDLGSAR